MVFTSGSPGSRSLYGRVSILVEPGPEHPTGLTTTLGIFAKDPVTGNLRTFSTPINGTGIFVTALGSNGLPLPNSKVGGGNLGRNTFRGPGFVSTNFSLGKNFSITER